MLPARTYGNAPALVCKPDGAIGQSRAVAPVSEPSGTIGQVVRDPCEPRAGQRPRPAATSICREPASGHVSVWAGAPRCYDRPRQLQGRAAISALKSARMTGPNCPSTITLPEAMRVSLVRYPSRSFLEIGRADDRGRRGPPARCNPARHRCFKPSPACVVVSRRNWARALASHLFQGGTGDS